MVLFGSNSNEQFATFKSIFFKIAVENSLTVKSSTLKHRKYEFTVHFNIFKHLFDPFGLKNEVFGLLIEKTPVQKLVKNT